MKTEKTNDVIGLGNALMDFLVEIDERQLGELHFRKGEFHLATEAQAQQLLDRIKQQQFSIEIIPGGSSANTMKALAFLGSTVILCGKVGDDTYGEMYIQQIQDHGVQARIPKHTARTGQAVTFITPDAERTFSVHLGAAVYLAPEDLLEEDIACSRVLHLEGYQLEGSTTEVVFRALELAQKHHTAVSIDLADPGLIRRNKAFLQEIVRKYSTIVFVNENEAKEFTGLLEEAAVRELAQHTTIAIVKLGARGSLICADNTLTRIPAFPAQVIDTTGAGDSYAAGFLHGYCRGWTIEQSGKLGSLLAAKVVEQKGMKVKHINVQELLEQVERG